MKFKKATFFIQKKDHSFESREGYFDEHSEFSFHKLANGWMASDVATGAGIVWRKTRKACAEFIENNYTDIVNARESKSNVEARQRKEAFIEELERDKSSY